MHFKRTVVSLILALWVCFAFGSKANFEEFEGLDADLKACLENPTAFHNKHIQKRDRNGQLLSTPFYALESIHAQKQLVRNLLADAGSVRTRLSGEVHTSVAPDLKADNPANVVDEMRVYKLDQMESAGLVSGKLDIQPWSDDYWPTYLGGVARRYSDSEFPDSSDWFKNNEYIFGQLEKSIDPVHEERLSPAEKYDLFVGDTSFTLTKQAAEGGRSYYESNGKVATWMGICHGWSPASYMLDRPKSAVNVIGEGGRKITFYPADIKALGSLLWANAPAQVRFIGKRCRIENPPSDENGRPVDSACIDTNPATWHLAVVNQIGSNKRGMVLDVTYDYEVWNQPILGYRYTYFNPSTLKRTQKLGDATVLTWGFSNDRYKNSRASGVFSVVGIAMDVDYLVETDPTHSPKDSERDDAVRTVRYIYDLELNIWGDIIGGEWYSKEHPDFLWTPVKEGRAVSVGDSLVESRGITKAAQVASKKSQPLARVVESLIEKSNQ